jgi:hypothetical protein
MRWYGRQHRHSCTLMTRPHQAHWAGIAIELTRLTGRALTSVLSARDDDTYRRARCGLLYLEWRLLAYLA